MKLIKFTLTVIIIVLLSGKRVETEEQKLLKLIETGKLDYDVVKVTMYTVDPKQTDDTPLITASGFIIDSLHPEKHRIIAVSRDLKRKYNFGTKVFVKGTGKWDGIYSVEDLMNKRWKKKIDILVNPDLGYDSFAGIRIYKINGK